MHHSFPKFSLDAAQAVNLCGIIYAVRDWSRQFLKKYCEISYE